MTIPVRKFHNSLLARLGVGILPFVVIVFVVSLGFLFKWSRDMVRQEAIERANLMLTNTSLRVGSYIQEIQTITNNTIWLVEENLVPEDHEVVGEVAREPGDVAIGEDLDAHLLVATGVHAEGADGEADGEEQGHEEHAALLQRGTARFDKRADADVIQRDGEHDGGLEEVVVDVEATSASAEVDTGHGDGKGVDNEQQAEEYLRMGEAFFCESDDDCPCNGHHRRKINDVTPLHIELRIKS